MVERPARVCVVGSGAREHALAIALSRTAEVVVVPGNPGMSALGVTCAQGPPESIDAGLFVIGPEAPLVDGLADRLRAAGRSVFGPGADGARLEGSKSWMKEVLVAAGVPTASFGVFSDAGPALEYLRSLEGPWVVKTDGLAAGKGVLVTRDLDEASADVVAKLSGESFGEAGTCVVIEECLEGPELSLMAICDGERALALAPAQDFKRVGDGDTGPNTGGMGAYSPVPMVDDSVVAEVMGKAVQPTLDELRSRGIDFRGVLYAGLMLTADGPRVLEFNVRFGDPESEVILPRWDGDVASTLSAAASGRLDEVPAPSFRPEAAVCVVLAAPGYPASPVTGGDIEGLDALASEDVGVYAAGVGSGADGSGLVTAGGRVLTIGALGGSLADARDRVYRAASTVSWPGIHWRSDIAARAAGLEREVNA
jgi:phosphoribosylamine---glycine ligase